MSIHAEPFERRQDDKEQLQSIMRERRAAMMVRSFMEKSRQYREPHLELARKAREMYENWKFKGRSPIMRANLRLPFGFTIIETQLPQLTDIFLRNERYVKFEGRTESDFQWEDSLTDFHQKQFDDMGFPAKFIQFTKGMLLDGTAIAKIPYRFQEINIPEQVPVEDPLLGEETTREVEVPTVLFDGPDFEPISIYDFFPDWSVKSPGDIKNMRGCVHRTWKTLAELRRNPNYKNIKKLEFSLQTRASSEMTPHFVDSNSGDFKEIFEELQDNKPWAKDPDKIEVWEYWGLWDPKGDGKFKQYIITVGHGDVVLRMEENFYNYKFKPFVASVNYPRDSEFYGIPELLSVRSLIKEANALRNARLDNVNISVNPMWKVDRASGVDIKSLYSRPNGIVMTNDMNGIAPLGVQDPSIGSLREAQDMTQEIQAASATVGTAGQLSQLGKTFGRSATGVEFINNIASSRVGMKARLMSNLLFRPMAWIMFMTNKQFVTEDQWVRVNEPGNPNPYRLLPTDAFSSKVDFKVQTDIETGGPEAEFSRLNMFTQMAQIAEQSQPGTVDFEKVFEQIGRKLFGPRYQKFTRSQEERMQMMQQQLAAEQAANAQTGQNAPQPNEGNPGGQFNGGGNFI